MAPGRFIAGFGLVACLSWGWEVATDLTPRRVVGTSAAINLWQEFCSSRAQLQSDQGRLMAALCPEQQAPSSTPQGLPQCDGTDRHVHYATQRSALLGAGWHDTVSLPHKLSACEQEATLNLSGMLQTELVSRHEQWDKLKCVLQVDAMRQQEFNNLPSLIAQIKKVQGCSLEAGRRQRPEAAQQPSSQGLTGNNVGRA